MTYRKQTVLKEQNVNAEIQKLSESIIYENHEQGGEAWQARFPGLVQLNNSELLVTFELSKTLDVSPAHVYISRSLDMGKNWQFQGPLNDVAKRDLKFNITEALKPTVLKDGSLIAVGYRFHQPDLNAPICNPDTGGLLWGPNLVSFSTDNGKIWTEPQQISHNCPETLEVSGPCCQLTNNDLVAIGPPFRLWDGSNPTGEGGVVLRSSDGGLTWNDSERYYIDKINGTHPFESRFCEMQPGRLVSIAWAYNIEQNRHYTNHVTVSRDYGHTWSKPIDTGHMGQASNLMWLKDDLLLTIHAHRAGDIGLYVRLIDFKDDKWNMLAEKVIWGGGKKDDEAKNLAEQFGALKFGQPSLLRLDNGEILACHWCKEDGLAKIKMHCLIINL